MKKFTSGKISIAALAFTLILVASFLLGKTATKTYANCFGDCGGGWSACISTEPQCGTDNGSQSKTSTQNRNYSWSCPSGYNESGGNCKKRIFMDRPYDLECPNDDEDYSSTDSSKACSRKVNIHGDGTSDKFWRYADMEKDYNNCPSGWGVVGNDHTKCERWDFEDKVKVFSSCPSGWIVNPDNESQCQKTESQRCQTGVIQYDSCTPAETCSESCGYEGGTVPDGKGGFITCDPTEACAAEASPTPNPDLCLNIEGIQYTVPEGLHINATGVECEAYGTPGVEQSSSSTPPGEVLGTSTITSGKVLGTSTMAGTGGFEEIAYQAIMVLGGTLSAFGIKNFKKASKKA